MGAAVTRFEVRVRNGVKRDRGAAAPASEPAAEPAGQAASWEALLRPALLPTVFVPGGAAPAPPNTSEDVAERKV